MQSKTGSVIKSDSRVAVGRRLAWFLFARLCVATLFFGGSIVYQLQAGPKGSPELPFLFWMVGLTYFQSGVSAYLLPKTDRLDLLLQSIVAWDLLLATFLLYLTGGSGSHFSFLYILIIFSASLFLRRRHIFLVASAAAILYGSLLDLQYYQNLPIITGLKYPENIDGVEVFYAIFLHVSAFLLTALLCSVLSESRLKSERDLKRKGIDLEELESLNRAILANINSGLMLVNTVGRIRSFNKSAEQITGLSLRDIYDRDVRTIFPCFDIFDGSQFNPVVRGQTDYQSIGKKSLALGYSTTRVMDVEKKDLGLLVVFQDLTDSIEMDRRLRQADQQAAVGRLASGMAHEIRNPLASISGSVQLLLEGGEVGAEDRRLMQIVVSEADRLSQLLTDFLSFAKPPKPEVEKFSVAELYDQVADMLQADHRFKSVKIIREYRPESTVVADRKQLRQVFFDLAINATESMQGLGSLFLGFDPDSSCFFIEDTGAGIDAELATRIFEPFFTTKDTGTGLGLATVHSIIQAHGGYIDVVAGRQGGAKFVVTLPKQGQQGFAVFGPESATGAPGEADS